MWVHSNHMGRGDDTPLNLGVVQNGNGLRTLTTQESHGFSRVECQEGMRLGYKEALLDSLEVKMTLLKLFNDNENE